MSVAAYIATMSRRPLSPRIVSRWAQKHIKPWLFGAIHLLTGREQVSIWLARNLSMAMTRRILLVFALALFALQHAPTQPPATPQAEPSYTKDVLPFLTKHCVSCHGNGKKKGGVSLDKFKDNDSVLRDRATWDLIVEMIQTKKMPPKEKPQPTPAEAQAVTKSIDAVLASFDCSKPHNVGRVTIRRLNRNEYNNTIRDLVGIDFKPAADFPADDVGYGFDNIGDVLTMSPLLLERYLAAAETILDKAIVIVDPLKAAKEKLGGLRASFGAGESVKVKVPYLHSKGEMIGNTTLETGDYVIRADVYGEHLGDEPVQGALKVNGNELKKFETKATSGSTATIVDAKLHIKAGQQRVAVAFLNPGKDPNDAKKQRLLYVRSISVDGPYNPPPPVLPDVHRKLMAHKDGLKPRESAREILTRFATRAFRRPVATDEVERLLMLYDKATKDGDRFENAVRLALYRVLVSPHFLFRVEKDPADAKAGKAYPVGEYALASRLSYFLWSSMPDEELFRLAGKGDLRKHLDAQVKRMLKDSKASAFAQNFSGQWLTLRSLANVNPDPKVFPSFDADLRAAMRKETEMFFEAILTEDRSILDFIDADFSFVNERLAKHYGIDGVKGTDFRRIKLPPTRGGILTQASILTLTSYPARTSPVQRGKWVLETVFNTPPPPPPEDVPALEEQKQLKGSLRQVMEQHRTNPVCASCHQRMDPIGFGFENYDAIGRWRDKDGGFDIDPSGVLPDGKTFKGPAELKTILRGKKELFARCLSEKVLTYALGRGLEYYDKCAVDKILVELAKNDYRFSTLLAEVVKSEPFLMRTAVSAK
jgi:mono/diheme cytochrome c family protein